MADNQKKKQPTDDEQPQSTTLDKNRKVDWSDDIFNNGEKLKRAAGVHRSNHLPPAHFRISKAKVMEFYNTLSKEEQKLEVERYAAMDREEKAEWLQKRPGYQQRQNQRRSKSHTRRSFDHQRKLVSIENTPHKSESKMPLDQSPKNSGDLSSEDGRNEVDLDAVGLASAKSLREKKAVAITTKKSTSRSSNESAKSRQQRNDHRVRLQRDKVFKEAAKLVHMTYGGKECGRHRDVRVLCCLENRIARVPSVGGRIRKGSEYLDKPEVIVVGHQIKKESDLQNWAAVIHHWTQKTDDELDLRIMSQNSQNNVKDDVSDFIEKERNKHSRPKMRPRTDAETTQDLIEAGATVVALSPPRKQKRQRT